MTIGKHICYNPVKERHRRAAEPPPVREGSGMMLDRLRTAGRREAAALTKRKPWGALFFRERFCGWSWC